MVFRGKVENGVVVLNRRTRLPEGTPVTVRPVSTRATSRKPRKRIPTLYERLKPFIGIDDSLPPDASVNIDHYLYGAPKRK